LISRFTATNHPTVAGAQACLRDAYGDEDTIVKQDACSGRKEWSRYYHDDERQDLEVLHARFIEHRYARHTHDYFVVALVEKGAVSYWYRGAQRVASADDIFVLSPDEPHTGIPAVAGGYVYRVLYPRAKYLEGIAADAGIRASAVSFQESIVHDADLVAVLSIFHRSLVEKSPSMECETLLVRALTRLITSHSDSKKATRPDGREHPAVRRACEYIQAHFAENVSLSRLAALVSLSPYYFARAFEKETGLPPHAYLENVRIRKAREFLDHGQTVVSAALSAGYVDQSHFTHRFKRFLGITPGQYVNTTKIGGGCQTHAVV
jgi:AraC-like DNA-binding protein